MVDSDIIKLHINYTTHLSTDKLLQFIVIHSILILVDETKQYKHFVCHSKSQLGCVPQHTLNISSDTISSVPAGAGLLTAAFGEIFFLW